MSDILFTSFGDPYRRLPGGLCNVGSSFYSNYQSTNSSLGNKFSFAFLGSTNISINDKRLKVYNWVGASFLEKFTSFLRLFFYVLRFRGPVVYVGTPILYFISLFKSPLRSIYWHHGVVSSEYYASRIVGKRFPIIPWFAYIFFLIVENLVFSRHASKHIYYNNTIKSFLPHNSRRNLFLPNFIPDRFLSSSSEKSYFDTINCLSVGFFVKRKRIDRMESLLIALSKRSVVNLSFVGSVCPKYKDEFWYYFNRYNSFRNINVEFCQDLSDAELTSKYDCSHILFHTSTAEGFPLVVQEAYSRSLIIVADKLVVNGSIPSDSIFDISSFSSANHILSLLNTPREYNIYQNSAYDFSLKNFSFEKFYYSFSTFINS